MAPELRFYRDNTGELMDQEAEQAKHYMKHTEEARREREGEIAQRILSFVQKKIR